MTVPRIDTLLARNIRSPVERACSHTVREAFMSLQPYLRGGVLDSGAAVMGGNTVTVANDALDFYGNRASNRSPA